MESPAHPKDPVAVARGKAAMRARWGPRRIVKLAELPPDVARVVRMLVDAAEAEAERAPARPAA